MVDLVSPSNFTAIAKPNSFADYQRLNDEFQLKKLQEAATLQKALSGGNLPAPLQLANEYQRRIAAGDTQGASLIAQFAKTVDKGITIDPTGNYQTLPGYGEAVGTIAAQKGGMEQMAKKTVDAKMNPIIAGGEANARNNSELNYAAPIAEKKETGKVAGEVAGTKLKKGAQADDTMLTLDLIEAKDSAGKSLLDKATGSGIGAIGASGKAFVGTSDESTQANADLAVLGNRLVNNVPRMEGPQSDSDRKFYVAQAGRIADPNVPAQDKAAALSTIRQLNEKYTTKPVVLKKADGSEAGGIKEGTIADNPQTGESVVFMNGAWKPLKGKK